MRNDLFWAGAEPTGLKYEKKMFRSPAAIWIVPTSLRKAFALRTIEEQAGHPPQGAERAALAGEAAAQACKAVDSPSKRERARGSAQPHLDLPAYAGDGARSASEAHVGHFGRADLGGGKVVNHVNAAPANPKRPVLGKRKAVDGPVRDMHYNVGAMKYHYCGGEHNKMNNVGPHKMFDCSKRALDKAAGVYRRNIWSRPSHQARKEVHEPTSKMRGNGKGTVKGKVRREVPLEECLAKAVAVDACNAEQDASPATANGDEDEPMDTVINTVNADATGKAQAAGKQPNGGVEKVEQPGKDSNQEIAETAMSLSGMLTEVEKKVHSLYPFLLDDEMYLTTNSWVLDSGCGHGLINETARGWNAKITRVRSKKNSVLLHNVCRDEETEDVLPECEGFERRTPD
ncbi:hypothetical protein ON010_g1306 [Phytophthora cinnamomi]|nr:hypothetical protein ON010_g1306 [Phytophthora cinnamomi]